MDRTIQVTGRAKISVRPDTTRLILCLEGQEKEYDKALRESSRQTEALRACIAQFGFPGEALRTLSFGVDSVYEGYEAKDHSWKQRFVGYRFEHRMKLEFPYKDAGAGSVAGDSGADGGLLGRILYGLAHCKANPEIHIEYFVADPEPVRNELLAKAVADSRRKAEVLADAAGVALGEVEKIDYSWGEVELVSRPMNRILTKACAEEACADAAYGLNVQPDDIDVTDSVTVLWGIR